ncbi:hypothetical protein CAPTEDRAFT_73209, partial [Capitella teleta]
WNTLPPMPTARRKHSSIYQNHHLYVVGGWDGSHLNSVEALDMRNLQWNHLPPLPRNVSGTHLAIVSDYLFVLGGFFGAFHDDSIEDYSPLTDSWS